MPKWSLVIVPVLLLAGAALVLRWAGGGDAPPPPGLEAALDGLEAVARSFPPPANEPLEWPRDHGSRPEQFTESWLFAGLVRDESGALLGFHLAIQRVAVDTDEPARESGWATRDVYRARLGLEAVDGEPLAEERLSRGALGLAGATSDPASAWVEDWRIEFEPGQQLFTLEALLPGGAIDLRLRLADTTPVTLATELYRGYWWPGLIAEGRVRLDEQDFEVHGRAMMERSWGRAQPIGRGQLALARLWLESPDGRGWRCERYQRRSGEGLPLLECLGYPQDKAGGPEVEPLPRGWETVAGVAYPLRWRVQPSAGSALALAPLGLARRPGPGWYGVLVDVAQGEQADLPAWGFIELSNFAAP